MKGIVIHPENALKFDFIIYKGNEVLIDSQKKQEYTKLIKYFLASLAVPDDNQWVNLSPYEKDRIIKEDFGKTEMGRDLLAQDYMLKQITASLIYPQDKLGQKFWDKVYAQAQRQFGTTNIPVNTFNKVWVVPDDALVYEKGNTAYVVKNHLKVMLEEDYLSLAKHSGITSTVIPAPDKNIRGQAAAGIHNKNSINALGSQIIREIILPELEREVNEGKNFAPLRQVFSGVVLAAWYKRALKESLLGKIYMNKDKVKGVDQNPKNNEAIYRQYLKAFKKGVFNFIKEDVDKYTNETIPRKYFSGGLRVAVYNSEHVLKTEQAMTADESASAAMVVQDSDLATAAATETVNPAMTVEDVQAFFNYNVNKNSQNLGRLDVTGKKVVQFEIGSTEQILEGADSRNGLGYRTVIVDQGNELIYQYTVNPNQEGFKWTPLMVLIRQDLEPTLTFMWKNSDFESYLGDRWRQLVRGIDGESLDAAMLNGNWKKYVKAVTVATGLALGAASTTTNGQTLLQSQQVSPITNNRVSPTQNPRVDQIVHMFDSTFSDFRTELPISSKGRLDEQPEVKNLLSELENIVQKYSDDQITGIDFVRMINANYWYLPVQRDILETMLRIAVKSSPKVQYGLLQQAVEALQGEIKSGGVSASTYTIFGFFFDHFPIRAIDQQLQPLIMGIFYNLNNLVEQEKQNNEDRIASDKSNLEQAKAAMAKALADLKSLVPDHFKVVDATSLNVQPLLGNQEILHVENSGGNQITSSRAVAYTNEQRMIMAFAGQVYDNMVIKSGLEKAWFNTVGPNLISKEGIDRRGEAKILFEEDYLSIVRQRIPAATHWHTGKDGTPNGYAAKETSRSRAYFFKDYIFPTGLSINTFYTTGRLDILLDMLKRSAQKAKDRKDKDRAALAQNPGDNLGGIDFNAANLNLQIKRDGKGVPLPVSQQDLENIHIDGLIPVIIEIKPAMTSSLLSQLQLSGTQAKM